MPFPYDKYPWLNFQELNLAYFIKHFREIFEQWDTLLNEMYAWKDATDEDLAEWKTTVETGISSWETGLLANLEEWKSQTATDISGWETATLAALDAWKTATTAVFEQIRTEAAASATAAAGSATSAQTAMTAAQAAQTAAEAAAAEIQSEATQIQTNTADISDLKTQITLDWTAIDAPLNPQRDGFIRYVDGDLGGSTTSKPTIFIDIHEYSKIKYKQQATTSGSTNAGMAFYRQNESYLTGIQGLYGQSTTGYAEELKETAVPPDAYYARFSTYIDTETYGSFALYGTKVIGDAVSELNETKQNKYIGAENVDDVLVVGEDGNITTKRMPLDLSEFVSTLAVSKADLTQKGYLSTTDGSYTDAPTSETQRTTPFIELESGAYYKIDASSINDGEATSGLRCVAIYNTDETFSRRLPSSGYSQFSLSGNEKYIRVNTNADEVYYLRVYKLSEGYEDKTKLSDNVIVPQVNKIDTTPYIHARRAVIGFIIDGEYDLNETMHDVFDDHNVKCGYAVPYNTDYPNNPITKYIEWQAEGFEILTHGNYAIPEDTTTPDATAIQRIKDSYNIMTVNGFNVKGFIGSSGSVAERFIPTIKNYYSWAATTANRKTSDETCIIYGTDKPYYLWRYSMQLSSLDQMKAAVDRAIANNYLLLFYGHANSENVDNFTEENLDALLTYIENAEGRIETPSKAVEDYFAVRYDDIFSLIS